MPVDLPPQPLYHIERAAPVAHSPAMQAIAAASRARADRTSAVGMPSVDRVLPPLDLTSSALTRDDRVALLDASRANWRGELANGSPRPSSYVGERIGVAVRFASEQNAMARGDIDPGRVHALRCRMVGLALDARAGAYLQGGEASAIAARRAIGSDVIAECRATAAAAGRRFPIVDRTPPVVVDMAPSVAALPMSVHPHASAVARVRIDLPARHVTHVDFKPPSRVRVDPVGQQRVHVANIAGAAASRGGVG